MLPKGVGWSCLYLSVSLSLSLLVSPGADAGAGGTPSLDDASMAPDQSCLQMRVPSESRFVSSASRFVSSASRFIDCRGVKDRCRERDGRNESIMGTLQVLDLQVGTKWHMRSV
eukprot:5008558-Pleurochrysis_carterae.AAC.2